MTLTVASAEVIATTLRMATSTFANATSPTNRESVAFHGPRYNVAPSEPHVVLVRSDGGPRLAMSTWGMLVRRNGHAQLLAQARSETVQQRPAFRSAFLHGRCAMIVDGFYEWHGPKHDRQPVYFRADGIVLLAAVCTPALPQESLPRFAVLTTAANQTVATIHERMPVVISRADIETWLDPSSALEDCQALLRPAKEDTFAAIRVSKYVNATRNDDANCIRPADAPLTLFD